MGRDVNAQEIATAIARLVPAWSVEKSDCQWSATIHGPDGEGLHIHTSFHHLGRDKMCVTGVYPQEGGGHFGQAVTNDLPEIGISIGRPVEDVVKEINRRLLPRYREVLAKARECQDRTREWNRQVEALTEELATLVGFERPADRTSHRAATYVDLPGDMTQFYGHAQVSSPYSVEITIHGAKPEVARRVLRVLVSGAK